MPLIKSVNRVIGIGVALLVLVTASSGVSLAQQIVPGSPVEQQEENPSQLNTDRQINDSGSSTDIAPVGNEEFRPTALGPNSTALPQSIDELAKSNGDILNQSERLKALPAPGEFQAYVQRLVGRPIPLFGQDLVLPSQRDFALPATATVPPDYLLNIGDTIVMSLTGSVGGSVERRIDTDGNIFLPSVGSVKVAGVRYGDLRETILDAVGMQYRAFDVSVSVTQLRGIRVYVTGFANNPGAFTLGSLSTLANAVFQAGGPSAGGSFRSVKLYRNGREILDFDLYQLVREGNRVNDVVLQNEDVLFIAPAGEQVAIIGSVQDEAIYEVKKGETIEQALALAGGLNVLADPNSVIVYNFATKLELGPRQIARAEATTIPALGGDIIQVLSRGTLTQPVAKQSMLVRIEGEVERPGNYFVPPNTPMADLLELAGGVTDRAFPFGAKLQRQSVKEQQSASYKEAVDQLEFSLATAPLVVDPSVSDNRRVAQTESLREVIRLLRSQEPDGRVVLGMEFDAITLPADLLLENNDRIFVPARPTTIGVFGAVNRPAAFLIGDESRKIKDYIDLAGGTQRAADKSRVFVVRANGEVLTRKSGALNSSALPGDVVFVPVKLTTTDIWEKIRNITTVFFQLGVTAAAVNSIR